jgi:serine-type D-Ala-D-Ala carboxypeptidase (penicillin-binding protein 5/6)
MIAAAHRRARSPSRWWPPAAVAILAAALGVLALLAPSVSDHRVVLVAPKKITPAHRPLYGALAAPAGERVELRLRRGLRSGLLFDVRTGAALWERDPERILPIASLTKMMTALVVMDKTKPSDSALITTAATHFVGSGIGLLPLGKRISVRTLLYGLLLVSGNDAAIALGQHVAGNQPRFIAMMNARVRRMGLRCTHFTSVSGIVDLGNHSCAADLATIAHAVLEQPLLARIVASRSAILPFPIKGHKLYLYNNNPLQQLRYPGVDGVKTGFTDAAGQCLVATARRGRAWLGVVLLHSANTAAQAQQLLNAGFARLAARGGPT